MIHQRGDGVKYIWNIRDFKEIGMMQYEVKRTTRPGKERLIYNRTIVTELFNFCDKPVGQYPPTKAMLYPGKTDREYKGVVVFLKEEDDINTKKVKYWFPYKKFLNSWDYEKYYEWGDIDISCKWKKKDSNDYYDRDYMVSWFLESENKDRDDIYYFDCDRMLYDNQYMRRKVSWRVPVPGTNGESYVIDGCKHIDEVIKMRSNLNN